MQHLAEICLSLAVDAKPGSLSELKVAASCSLVWPSRLPALRGWLTDWLAVNWRLIDKLNNACVCVCAAAVELCGTEI